MFGVYSRHSIILKNVGINSKIPTGYSSHLELLQERTETDGRCHIQGCDYNAEVGAHMTDNVRIFLVPLCKEHHHIKEYQNLKPNTMIMDIGHIRGYDSVWTRLKRIYS